MRVHAHMLYYLLTCPEALEVYRVAICLCTLSYAKHGLTYICMRACCCFLKLLMVGMLCSLLRSTSCTSSSCLSVGWRWGWNTSNETASVSPLSLPAAVHTLYATQSRRVQLFVTATSCASLSGRRCYRQQQHRLQFPSIRRLRAGVPPCRQVYHGWESHSMPGQEL